MGRTTNDLVQPWPDEVADFLTLREQYLLY
jgi:hypothetical protein